MSETEKSFTIKDRRHFTADGRVREDVEPDTPAAHGEPPTAPATEVHESPTGERAEAAPTAQAAAGSPSSADDPGPPGGSRGGPADFTQFLLSLGVQASALLSGQGLPEEVDPKAALTGAQSIISILEMLGEKTEGHRTAQEDEVLEGLLYELRMAYVEKSRAGGS